VSGEQAQGEEEDGWEEEGTTLCTIRPLQPLKGSPLMWCKGLRIAALKTKGGGLDFSNGVGVKGEVSFSSFLGSVVSSSRGCG